MYEGKNISESGKTYVYPICSYIKVAWWQYDLAGNIDFFFFFLVSLNRTSNSKKPKLFLDNTNSLLEILKLLQCLIAIWYFLVLVTIMDQSSVQCP